MPKDKWRFVLQYPSGDSETDFIDVAQRGPGVRLEYNRDDTGGTLRLTPYEAEVVGAALMRAAKIARGQDRDGRVVTG